MGLEVFWCVSSFGDLIEIDIATKHRKTLGQQKFQTGNTELLECVMINPEIVITASKTSGQ